MIYLRNRQMFSKTHRHIDRTLYEIQSPEDFFSNNWKKIICRVGFSAKYNFTSKARYNLEKTG